MGTHCREELKEAAGWKRKGARRELLLDMQVSAEEVCGTRLGSVISPTHSC